MDLDRERKGLNSPRYPANRGGFNKSKKEKGGGSGGVNKQLLGLLRIRVRRGINLAVRDIRTSDPYVVVKMANQRLKTRVIKKDVNPEWNEDLTLSITDPNIPVQIEVYDHDTFTADDKMGDAEFDIKAFVDAKQKHLQNVPPGTTVARIQPSRQNCLAEESCVIWNDGQVSQDLCLRLRNVECGEVVLSLHWVDVPGINGLSFKQ